MTYAYIFILIYIISIPLAVKTIHRVIDASNETDIIKDLMHSYGNILAFLPILNTAWSITQLSYMIMQNKRRKHLGKAKEILTNLRSSIEDEETKDKLGQIIDEMKKLDNQKSK